MILIVRLIVWISLFLPLLLLAFVWNKVRTPQITLIILTISSLLLISSSNRTAKWIVLGPDYSNRLFTTIGLNLLLAVGIGIYMVIKRRWDAGAAAIVLALAWFIVWSINSVV
jgi:preprotein translocase subunit SecF